MEVQKKCIGCMIGVTLGDVLGAAVEGHPPDRIKRNFPNGVRDFVSATHMGIYHLPERLGMYTDDTNSTIALARSLIEKKGLSAADCALKHSLQWELGCTQQWDPQQKDYKILQQAAYPLRGYPGSMQSLMQSVIKGADVRQTGTLNFPDGSYGNGGAMRIAPVALAFRQADAHVLKQAVEAALLFSHVNPEAVCGTLIHALAIQFCFNHTVEDFVVADFLDFLRPHVYSPEMKKAFENLSTKWNKKTETLADLAVPLCTNGFQIFTPDAVLCTLMAFLRHYENPEEALVQAVGIGGDTDTVASMCGALVGALHGTDWWPSRWWEKLENGDYGRDHIVSLAKQLADLNLNSVLQE